jgi:hypothetical protein
MSSIRPPGDTQGGASAGDDTRLIGDRQFAQPGRQFQPPNEVNREALAILAMDFQGQRVALARRIESTARLKVEHMSGNSGFKIRGYLQPGESGTHVHVVTDKEYRVIDVYENIPPLEGNQRTYEVGVILKPDQGLSVLHEESLPKDFLQDLWDIGIGIEKRTKKI